MPIRRALLISSAMVVLLAAASPLMAGDLNPPAGPVAPTMLTLDEIEPRIAGCHRLSARSDASGVPDRAHTPTPPSPNPQLPE